MSRSRNERPEPSTLTAAVEGKRVVVTVQPASQESENANQPLPSAQVETLGAGSEAVLALCLSRAHVENVFWVCFGCPCAVSLT